MIAIRMTLSLLLMLLFLAQPARAGGSNAYLTEAKEHFHRMDYDKAVKTLKAAISRRGNSTEDVLEIYRLMGVCLASMGKEAEAEEAFSRLLAIAPDYRFPTDRSPRLTAPLEAARKRAGRGIVLRLEPSDEAKRKEGFSLNLHLEDPVGLSVTAVLMHRAANQPSYAKTMVAVGGKSDIIIKPPLEDKAPYHDYHLLLTDAFGGVLREVGSASKPQRLVLVDPETLQAGPAWHESWWFWTIVGTAVAAGAGVTTYILWPQAPDHVDFQISTR